MGMLIGALSSVFWGLVLLSILVFVHEGGHYLAARAFGVRVTEFFLGLPSRFKLSRKSKKCGTEFGVTVFMLGGYNRICGMEIAEDELLAPAFAIVQREGRVKVEDLAEELGIDVDRAYALLVGLADLAAIRPFYDPDLGEYPTQKEYPASFETLARDANMLTEYDKGHDFSLPGSTEVAQPRPLEDAEEQLAQESAKTYRGIGFAKRLLILCAGPLVNLILAFVLVTGAFMAVEYEVLDNVNVVGTVTEGSIAQAAGLEAGDKILQVGEASVSDWVDVSEALRAACEVGEDFPLVYERDGKRHEVVIDLPQDQKVEAIGVRASTHTTHLTFGEAAKHAVDYAKMVGGVAVRLIMPQHTMEVLEQSTSIVGVSVMASRAASAGIFEVIALLAAVSMSLGFMNLLPIPPLDGGKMVIEVVQLLIRRPLSPKAQAALSYVGVAFFVFVFVFVLRNDILRFVLG
ncbi:MAG: M50 family metallopeptidase [Coriobacteriales bacterium]|nr:M50 family metallopeptidase [Coriobacteriales bacterium]